MKKIIKNNIIGFIISCMLFGVVTVVVASQTLSSSSVEYKDNKSVETALNELYSKKNQLYKKYKVGDSVTVKNAQYHVIADSSPSQNYVTLLKDELLTVDEVNANKIGTDGVNHVNKYTSDNVGVAKQVSFAGVNPYGGVAFYTSSTCGNPAPGEDGVVTSCDSENASNYDSSDIKYVVDNWANNVFHDHELKKVNNYKARLIEKEELRSNFYPNCVSTDLQCSKESTTPSWITSGFYWTMTPSNYDQDFEGAVLWTVYFNRFDGDVTSGLVNNNSIGIRPVINIYKSKI